MISKDEYCSRFIEFMTGEAGFTHFQTGEAVIDYAKRVAADYWINSDARDPNPEGDAEADMDCWED